MCDHRANTVNGLKQHLTTAHVEPQTKTQKIRKEKQSETFEKEESFMMDKQVEVKVKKQGDHLIPGAKE